VVVDRQEVVVITPDLARRFAMRGDAEPAHRHRALREEGHLDAARDAQLLLHPLLFRLLDEQILDARGHRVERLGQLAELIAGSDGDAPGEVAAADPLGAGKELVDRAGDRLRQRQAHGEGDALDNQKQDADTGQNQQQTTAEVGVPLAGD
jgi:hypothetical protein